MKDEQESNQMLYRRALARASELENANHDPELQNLFDGVTSLGNENSFFYINFKSDEFTRGEDTPAD